MKPEVEIEQMLSAGERVTGAAAFAPAHGSLLQDQGLGQRSTTARPRRTECECCGDENAWSDGDGCSQGAGQMNHV